MGSFEIALKFASAGVPVIPCRESDSARGRAKAPYVSGGFHSASSSPELITFWMGQYPAAMVGLPCALNGLIVLDADRHGNGDGVENATALFDRYSFDPYSVPVVRTPSNGRHYYFSRPADLVRSKRLLISAVDIRDNGYVIAAGSRLSNGKGYHLENGRLDQLMAAIGNRALPLMPDWLEHLVEDNTGSQLASNANAVSFKKLSNSRLGGLLKKIASATQGERNDILYWGARTLRDSEFGKWLSKPAAESALIFAGLSSGLDRIAVVRTVHSGLGECWHGC